MRLIRLSLPGLIFVLVLILTAGRGEDWPQLLGPNRNGTYAGSPLAEHWPKEGPPVVWQRKVGQGFSGPAVASEKLILFHRLEDKETIECLETQGGKSIWKFDYVSHYQDDFGFDEGPRATPTISGDKVYTFGAEGVATCLDLKTGKQLWTVETGKLFQAPKGFFGMVCSPLVEGPAVLLDIGGNNGAGIVAFNKENGKLLWKSTEDEASYSSPVIATIEGQRMAVFLTRAGLKILEPGTGEVRFQYPWRARLNASVNAATPLVIGDNVFVSASYQTGAILLKAMGRELKKVWSADDVLSNHYATSIHHDGYLYGFDGRQEQGPRLRCVELQTGKVRWTQEDLGAGTVTLANDRLLILTEKGELVLAEAVPEAFKVKARAQIMPREVRAYPAMADGRLYARSKSSLFCVDLH